MKANQTKYWTAFYTKPRNEKKVAERLGEKGFTIYCPVRSVLKQWSDRKKKVKEVLFTSYLFAQVDETERTEILQDQGIVSSVFWLKEPVRIPESEIQGIKDFLSNHENANIELERFQQGETLQIHGGPFKGEEGVVEQIKGNKVVLSLKSLSIDLKAEIPASQLA